MLAVIDFLKAAGKLVVLAAEAMKGCFIVRIRHLKFQVAYLYYLYTKPVWVLFPVRICHIGLIEKHNVRAKIP